MRTLLTVIALAAVLLSSLAPAQEQRRRFGGPVELGPDDKPAFPDPPDGYDVRRDGIAVGKLEMIEYDSKTVGTRRKMQVYTPPGYSKLTKYPVLYHFAQRLFKDPAASSVHPAGGSARPGNPPGR